MSFLSEKLEEIKELKPMVEKPNRKADERMYKILVVATTQIWEKQKPEIEQFLTSCLQDFADKIRLEELPTDNNEEIMYGDTDYNLNTVNVGKNEAKYELDRKIANLLANNVKE